MHSSPLVQCAALDPGQVVCTAVYHQFNTPFTRFGPFIYTPPWLQASPQPSLAWEVVWEPNPHEKQMSTTK